MGKLNRWTASIGSSFEWIVNQVENHSAVVNSALKEMQEAAAKAKIQLRKVQSDGEKLREKLKEVTEKEAAWKQRALNLRDSNREKALECIKRQKRAAHDIEHFQKELKTHEKFEKQLIEDLKTVNDRIEQLRRKKNALSARQFRAEAMHASEDHDLSLVTEIDDIFDRWEVKISKSEVYAEPIDDLEDEFVTAESNEELEAELDALV